MKKIIALLTVLVLFSALIAPAYAAGVDVPPLEANPLATVIVENIAEIVKTLFVMLIGLLGAWLTSKLAKQSQLTSINAAQQEVIAMAQITVGELMQALVNDWKEKSENGKLTEEQIKELGIMLVEKTKEKMSATTINFLNAVGVDVIALIHGAGEDWINSLKSQSATAKN